MRPLRTTSPVGELATVVLASSSSLMFDLKSNGSIAARLGCPAVESPDDNPDEGIGDGGILGITV
jgi:hypothetical protein